MASATLCVGVTVITFLDIKAFTGERHWPSLVSLFRSRLEMTPQPVFHRP